MATAVPPTAVEAQPSQHGWRFWAIFAALSITSILSALDISVISTALPTITKDLAGSTSAFVWVATSYLVTSVAFQPLYGQTANVFGRRSLTIAATLLFAIGSAVSGAARNINMLIAGRAIQGIGGGGINILVEIIVCDLVPLRERPKYLGVIFVSFAVAMGLGPVIGGIMTQRVTWRWIFYMNLPIAGAALVLLFLFLHVEYNKDSFSNLIRRVDFTGNALLIASVVAVLLALTWGGTESPWSSARTLVPLILGLAGHVAFLVIESISSLVREPTMPLRLFSNRTSLGSFGLTFIHAVLTGWVLFFLPLYFQSVLEASPTASGVNLLPTAVGIIPFAIVAGAGVSVLGKYRPFQFAGIALITITFGLFTLLNEASSTGYWVGTQILGAAGCGLLLTTTLPAIQAPLAEADQAIATATWGFLRSFGAVWGVSIPAAIFNSRVNALVDTVDDVSLRRILVDGGAYAMASKEFMQSLDAIPEVKKQVVGVYVAALRLTWEVGIAFGLLGFLVALVVKEVPMREQLETDYGMAAVEGSSKVEDSERNGEDEKKQVSTSASVE
ncbi:multidrug resistance protein Fnx1 [Immersiella caudata]|uniref:Multidrug resistance protein Fnx1 n=1 Tax=Immersiella caudata TaxID=314043 RepID=A0AA39WKC8_9PEZI|nr:multidrug resistance protein Fnx1 [Immersiella caudata]